jgi:hypothetical protein
VLTGPGYVSELGYTAAGAAGRRFGFTVTDDGGVGAMPLLVSLTRTRLFPDAPPPSGSPVIECLVGQLPNGGPLLFSPRTEFGPGATCPAVSMPTTFPLPSDFTGVYEGEARARDAAGNLSAPQSFGVIVDLVPPECGRDNLTILTSQLAWNYGSVARLQYPRIGPFQHPLTVISFAADAPLQVLVTHLNGEAFPRMDNDPSSITFAPGGVPSNTPPARALSMTCTPVDLGGNAPRLVLPSSRGEDAPTTPIFVTGSPTTNVTGFILDAVLPNGTLSKTVTVPSPGDVTFRLTMTGAATVFQPPPFDRFQLWVRVGTDVDGVPLYVKGSAVPEGLPSGSTNENGVYVVRRTMLGSAGLGPGTHEIFLVAAVATTGSNALVAGPVTVTVLPP